MTGCRRAALIAWLAVRSLTVARSDVAVRLGTAAVAVLLLLVGAALGPTAEARSGRVADAMVPLSTQPSPGDGVRAALVDDYWHGQPVRTLLVATERRTVSWHGVRLPAPGEVVTSPQLARELEGSPTLRARYPGRRIGHVPDALLVGPRQLVVWRGVAPDRLPENAGWMSLDGRGGPSDIRESVPGELQYAYPLLAVGFLVPLVALMALLSSLGATRREQRLAALRLVGLQDRDAKVSAALEDGLIGAAGCLAGLAAFWLLVPTVSARLPIWGGLWADDIAVSWTLALPLMIAFPVVAVASAYAGLRGLRTSPLGVERRTRHRTPSAWRLVPLLVGVAGVGMARPSLIASADVRAPLVIAAIGWIMVGLAAAVPLLVAVGARRARSRAGSLTGLLAASRIAARPVAVARVAVGLTCMVVVSGPLLVFFPLIGDVGASSYHELASTVGPDTLVVVEDAAVDTDSSGTRGMDRAVDSREAWSELERSDEVETLLAVDVVTVRGAKGQTTVLGVVDCRDLARLVAVTVTDCSRGLVAPDPRNALPGGAVRAVVREVRADGRERERATGPAFEVPSSLRPHDIVDHLDAGASLGFDAIVASASLPAAALAGPFPRVTFVEPVPGQLEPVRNLVLQATGQSALSVHETYEIASRTTKDFTLLTAIAAALIVTIAGLSTLVSATDEVRTSGAERRLLEIGGAPTTLLARTLLLTMVVPVLVGVLPATGLTLVSAAAFLSLASYYTAPVPVVGVLAAAGLALAAPVLATAVVARRARDADAGTVST